MRKHKPFVWSWATAAVIALAVLAFYPTHLPQYALFLIAALLGFLAIWFTGRDLAKAQNEAAGSQEMLSGIHSAVRATSNAPPGLREKTMRLSSDLWMFIVELFKAEIVPPPEWSKDVDSDCAKLLYGYQKAQDRRNVLLTSARFRVLNQQFISVRSALFNLRRPDGSYLLSRAEMQTIQNMSTDKAELEIQAYCLGQIAARLHEAPANDVPSWRGRVKRALRIDIST